MDADVVEIGDEDYGLFYIDIFDNVKKYLGKTIRFKAYVCQTKRVPEGCFVARAHRHDVLRRGYLVHRAYLRGETPGSSSTAPG